MLAKFKLKNLSNVSYYTVDFLCLGLYRICEALWQELYTATIAIYLTTTVLPCIPYEGLEAASEALASGIGSVTEV